MTVLSRVTILLAVGLAFGGANDIEMVFVEGGTFTMGCTEEQGGECADNEKPAHKVTLSSFYIQKHEVTMGLWRSVMGKIPTCRCHGSDSCKALP